MNETADLTDSQTATAARAVADLQPLFHRILVPTDFSQRSEVAVDYAIELARKMHGQLTLLHVVPEPSALDYNIGGFPRDEWDQTKEEAEKKLADALAHAKRSLLEVDATVRTGVDLHEEILRVAKQISADLLVLSTHGYTGWKHLLFGSDAEKILQHASCPILVVR
jgi:nucleotide-binding universal stress UspA family protein